MQGLTKEKAINLFRQMWTDAQKELGDTPSLDERVSFKRDWCEEHFPGEYIAGHCFLCQYGYDLGNLNCCWGCPIDWPKDICGDPCCYKNSDMNWCESPISKFLALPEREIPKRYQGGSK